MYLTDAREQTLQDVIRQLEPELFQKVTGLTIKDLNEATPNYHFATLNGSINDNLKKIAPNYKNHLFHPIRDFDIIKMFEDVD